MLPLVSYGDNWEKLRQSMRALGGNEQVFDEWNRLINSVKSASIERKLQGINQFFNRKLLYAEDIDVWGQSDYWATPLESLARGKGDCEDFVIAKYFSLRSAGLSDQQLRLVYVRAKIGGERSTISQAHMVLAFYASSDAEPLILDNLITDIRPASRRTDLSPVFSFNAQGVFAGTNASTRPAPGGTSRLSRWQDLLERARQEGFELSSDTATQ
ncbi:MAG: transglutaminase-like cysteine peptidase [Burkholderiales bacterium]|nr:transglutaminase-like cysteine peptidase [Burkholderiales bacterium]